MFMIIMDAEIGILIDYVNYKQLFMFSALMFICGQFRIG